MIYIILVLNETEYLTMLELWRVARDAIYFFGGESQIRLILPRVEHKVIYFGPTVIPSNFS